MQFLTWREVDFASVALAGVVGGYVMALTGLWLGSVPGFVAIDIADFGRRYMVSDRPIAWVLGFGSHLMNSLLLTLLWASVIVPNLELPRLISGIAWGLVVAIGLSGLLVGPLAGMGALGLRVGRGFLWTTLVMHAVWGALLGLLYVPPS